MAAYNTGSWLSKNQYQRIRYRAKKMGANNINLAAIWHHATFGCVSVSFMFRPFQAHANFINKSILNGAFRDKAGADSAKADIDKALEFIEYLKEFNQSEVEKS